jgi:hypothetical protein
MSIHGVFFNLSVQQPGNQHFWIAHIYYHCFIHFAFLESNSNDQNPLVLAYAKSRVHELVTGKKNACIETKIMNFIRFIGTISLKVAEISSANLSGGPSKHWMQKLNANERKGCLLDSSVAYMKARLSAAVQRHKVAGHSISYSLLIDATKVPSESEISTVYSNIMGGCLS